MRRGSRVFDRGVYIAIGSTLQLVGIPAIITCHYNLSMVLTVRGAVYQNQNYIPYVCGVCYCNDE
jgi:hypothetical protein